MPLTQTQLYTPSVISALASVCQRVGGLNALLEGSNPSASEQQLAAKAKASLQFDGLAEEHLPTLAQLYADNPSFTATDEASLKNLHRQLLGEEDETAGQYRSTGMGFYRHNKLVHMTAAANQVPKLLQQLLLSLDDANHHPLLQAINFLYEYEYIQPFSKANGCIGRLWFMRLLQQWHPVLMRLPFEPLLLERQEEYFVSLKHAIANNDVTPMACFLLELIDSGVEQLYPNEKLSASSEINGVVSTEFKVSEGSEKQTTRDKILHLLTQQPRWSAARVAEVIGISSRAVEKHISRLKSEGVLVRDGSARAGEWRVTKRQHHQLSLPEY